MRPLLLLTAALAFAVPAAAPAQVWEGWPDPTANDVVPYKDSGLTHGPMLGRPTAAGVRVWVRTARPTAFTVVYATALPLSAESPGVRGTTEAVRDNTAFVDLAGLEPNTRYFYAVVLDGALADLRMDFDRPWPSFCTLPDADSYRDDLNPRGLYNLCFSIGCGNRQAPNRYGSPASFFNLVRKHRDGLLFHLMNGDFIYEEPGVRKGGVATLEQYRENYRIYIARGRSMAEYFRLVPTLFTIDDHELGTERGRGPADASRAWDEYAGWANLPGPRGPMPREGGTAAPAFPIYFDFRLANCHFFALDCRRERAEGTILGEAQRKWLLDGVAGSDADFLFIVSSVPWVIPHTGAHVRPGNFTPKGDSFLSAVEERERLLEAFDGLARPVLILTGDVHNSFAIRITDNVWEFMCGPMNSQGHPIATAGDPPFGGVYDSAGRKIRVRWVAGWPNNAHYTRLQSTLYTIVQVNNVLKSARPEGAGLQWVAYDAPQVVVRFHDGYSGNLLYAEAVSTMDVKEP